MVGLIFDIYVAQWSETVGGGVINTYAQYFHLKFRKQQYIKAKF